jgi:hypothetical protein
VRLHSLRSGTASLIKRWFLDHLRPTEDSAHRACLLDRRAPGGHICRSGDSGGGLSAEPRGYRLVGRWNS